MFNRLEIKAQSLLLFRCRGCLQILFRQDDIDQYIRYDSTDLGVLEKYSNFPKYQDNLQCFLLAKNTYISTLQIDYEHNLILNYHPFFKMYVFEIQCSHCHLIIGFQIETVNENTTWMEGRILIDAQKISILKQGKNQINRLLKILQSRLDKKLKILQQSLQQTVQNKEKQIIQKLQKMNTDKGKKSQSLKSQFQKNQIEQKFMKKRIQSLQTTNVCTNYVTKLQTGQNANTQAYQSDLIRVQSNSYNDRTSLGSKTLTVISEGHLALQKRQLNKSSAIQQSQQDKNIPQLQEPRQKDKFHQFQLDQQQRDKTAIHLKTLRQQILKQAGTLHTSAIISKLFMQLDRIDSHFMITQRKSISQLLQINGLLTKIRKHVIQSFNQNV